MGRLGIISESIHVHVFPKKGKTNYYCLYWGLGTKRSFTTNSACFYFSSHQKLQGPQELTAWQD